MRWLGGFLILVGLAFCQGGLIILGFPLIIFGINFLRHPGTLLSSLILFQIFPNL